MVFFKFFLSVQHAYIDLSLSYALNTSLDTFPFKRDGALHKIQVVVVVVAVTIAACAVVLLLLLLFILLLPGVAMYIIKVLSCGSSDKKHPPVWTVILRTYCRYRHLHSYGF